MDQPIENKTFDTGTPVTTNGTYVCSPCGYKKQFATGETFPECDSCMKKKGEPEDPDDVMPPSGIWEYVDESEEGAV